MKSIIDSKDGAICRICGNRLETIDSVTYYGCFNKENTPYIQALGYCKSCDMVEVINPPEINELDYLYNIGDDYTNFNSKEAEKADRIKRVSKMISYFHTENMKFSRVLDVGASTGYALDCIRKSFKLADYMGIETSYNGVKSASDRYSLKLFHGDFHEFAEINSNKYDLVCIAHVLEHIVDIKEFFYDLVGLSQQYVYVEVPALMGTGEAEPYGFFVEEHINYFTPKSLNKLFQYNGFEAVNVSIDYMCEYKTANGFPMIAAIYKRSDKQKMIPGMKADILLNNYLTWSKIVMDEVRNRIAAIPDQCRLAVWGCSFQLRRLLSYTTLVNKHVVAVIDNSTVRQKRKCYIGGEEYNIISINDLDYNVYDRILITSWNSQESMLNDLRRHEAADKAVVLYENI